ncbi:hypothetical protein IJJ05_02905 [Candidatus Saccharibacteria bacterium]|nr:hypothetical protein [Candidatus Saccharibacteria bacterium]
MRKFISKTTIISLLAALIMGVGVSAATDGNVLTLVAEQNATSGEISFSGTTDLSVIAVSCILSNAAGEEMFFGSMQVDGATFEGTFVMPVDSYTLMCANYDGGDWVSAEIGDAAVPDAQEDETTEESPDTGYLTSGERGSAIMMPITIAGAVILTMFGISLAILRNHKN